MIYLISYRVRRLEHGCRAAAVRVILSPGAGPCTVTREVPPARHARCQRATSRALFAPMTASGRSAVCDTAAVHEAQRAAPIAWHQWRSASRAATPRRTQWDCGWSDGSSMLMTKLVEWPVVDSTPYRDSVLYTGAS